MSLLEQYFVEMEAVAPYSFELTLRKPAGWWWSTPDEKYDNSTCWTATRFNHKLLGLKLQSIGKVQNPRILCTVFSKTKMDASQKEDLTQMLKRALKTEEDLSDFYKLDQNDPVLQSVVKDLYGMHTVGWPELFPALILAVTLQMAPMKRSDQMMDLLIANFGDSVSFDGKSMLYWPPAEKIAESSVEELKAKAKLGYRAANLVAIAKALTSGFPTMDELWMMDSQEAKKKLLTLRGIGDYSAELVMPQMGFLLDVWSAKIFSILFYGKNPQNPREAIPPLKQFAEERWEIWKGYAFVYVLNDPVKLSQKVGTDLTVF